MYERIYAAYGSNMDETQMKRRCPKAKLVGRGEVVGLHLLFKGSGSGVYATLEEAKDFIGMQNRVPVILWSITPQDEKALDHYEGFPHFYYKQDICVDRVAWCRPSKRASRLYETPSFDREGKYVLDEDVKINVAVGMAYIMHEDRLLGRPGKAYYRLLRRAYERFMFDTSILDAAVRFSGNHKGEV